MPSPKIKLDHTRLDTPGFIARMREIHAAMSASAAFVALAPKLVPFAAEITSLENNNNVYVAGVQAAKQAMTQRDSVRGSVEEIVRGLASAAEGETSDDASLQNGGWHLRGPPVPVGPMTAPQSLSGTGGDQEGEVDLSWQPVDGRDTYLGEHAASATGPWTQFYVGKKSSVTGTGLTSGTLYWFRIRAVGTAGPGPWSDPAVTRVT